MCRTILWATVQAESRESFLHVLRRLQRRGGGLRGDDGRCCRVRFPRTEVSSSVWLHPRVLAVRRSRLPVFLSSLGSWRSSYNSALVVSGSVEDEVLSLRLAIAQLLGFIDFVVNQYLISFQRSHGERSSSNFSTKSMFVRWQGVFFLGALTCLEQDRLFSPRVCD